MAFKTNKTPAPKGYQVNPGDLVKFTRGHSILQGEIDLVHIHGRTLPGLWVSMEAVPLERLYRDGYKAEVIKAAEHKLPEQPGIYITENNLALELKGGYFADGLGWAFMGLDTRIKHRELSYSYLPLTLIKAF